MTAMDSSDGIPDPGPAQYNHTPGGLPHNMSTGNLPNGNLPGSGGSGMSALDRASSASSLSMSSPHFNPAGQMGMGGGMGGGGGMGVGMPPTQSQAVSGLVLAGFGDGAVKLFDARASAEANPVAAFNEHRNWVVSVHLNGTREAVSGSISGDVRFWDLRMSESIRSLDAHGQSGTTMTALAAHPRVPVLATGSHAQFIRILTLDGVGEYECTPSSHGDIRHDSNTPYFNTSIEPPSHDPPLHNPLSHRPTAPQPTVAPPLKSTTPQVHQLTNAPLYHSAHLTASPTPVLNWIRYHDGFLGQRIGPVSCLAFHPNKPLLAAGATDSIISIYTNSE